MQALLEFAPLVAFLVAYKMGGIYAATAVLMGAMCLLVLVTWLRTRAVGSLMAISTVLVVVFGGITLWLRDERFIQWKPTVFFWALGIAFLVSQWVGAKPLVQRLMESALAELVVPRSAWLRLNVAWVVFYLVLGAANLVVVRTADEATWVNFKVYGLTAATLVFVIAQALWLQRKGVPTEPGNGSPPP